MKKEAGELFGIPFCLYLPDLYTNKIKIPVVFFLLGLDFHLDDLEETLQFSAYYQAKETTGQPFAVCAIDGKNSWYCNHHTGKLDWEDIFIRDFVKEIFQQNFLSPLSCGIAGISMGGFGAFHLGLKYPHIFQVIAGHSASLRFKDEMETALKEGRLDLNEAFGNVTNYLEIHPINYIMRTTHYHQYVWLDCGKDDFHIDNNLKFFTLAKDYLSHLEFHVFEGRHDAVYWKNRLGLYLDYYEEKLYILQKSF